jgi:predicted DNA-binding transcriptional regulator YafY
VPDDRFERLANLVTFLLDAENGATYPEIVAVIPGYPEGDDTRRRAFERDKKLLRDEDIPLVEQNGVYRIPPEEYYLPDLGLTEDEQLALRLAVAAVPVGGDQGGAALQKLTLGATPGEVDVAGPPALADIDEHPLLPALHGAIRRHAVVTFGYGGTARRVEPSLLFFRDGFWYLNGFDHTRDDQRNFRVERIEGEVEVGPANGFEPRQTPRDPQAAMPREPWLIGGDERESAVVRVDAVLAAKATADAGPSATVDRSADGSVTITMQIAQLGAFRSWVLGMLDHAEVLGPPEIRQAMTDWLRAVAASA